MFHVSRVFRISSGIVSPLVFPSAAMSYNLKTGTKLFFNPYTARIKQCYVWVYSPGNRFGRQFRPTRAWKLRGSVLLEPIFVSLWKVSSVRFTRSRFSEKLLAGKLRDNTVIVCLALPIRNQFIPF